MIRYLIFALLLCISNGRVAHAEVGSASLRDLVKSDHIVYARVERMHVVGRNWRLDKKGNKIRIPINTVAEARVVRVFQGKGISTGQTIFIAAYRTWACDGTRISLGEESMFFLEKRDVRQDEGRGGMYPGWEKDITKFLGEKPLYAMVYWGQGQLPISIARGGEISVPVSRTKDRVAYFGETRWKMLPTIPISWDARIKKAGGGTVYQDGHISVESMERFLGQLIAEESVRKEWIRRRGAPRPPIFSKQS